MPEHQLIPEAFSVPPMKSVMDQIDGLQVGETHD